MIDIQKARISFKKFINKYKNLLDNPVIKKYDTFELIQLKNDNSIINIISLRAKDDYNIKE